jgi:hypothetical protein
MKKNYTYLIFTISTLITILVVATFIFFFKVIQNKNEHTSKVLTVLADKMEDKKNAEILIKKFSEIESVEDELNLHFVDPAKIDTFVDYLEKLGLNNNVELSVKNVEILSKIKDTLLIKVSITGSFINVMRVIYLIENTPYNISLTQAFVNKEIKTIETTETTETETKGIKKEIKPLVWQADISFNILSLPQL